MPFTFFNGPMMQAWPFLPFIGMLLPLVLLDIGLKAWGMWRAARMGKLVWFVALFFVNSLGILPGVFLLLTKEEYEKRKLVFRSIG